MVKQALYLIIFTVLIGTTLTPNAWAQEEEYDELMEEVVVTATRRETALMETPLAVSAFDQDTLNREGVANIVDIGELVPNMQVGLSPSDSSISSRN